MKFLGFLVLLDLHSAAAVKHSLKYFVTASQVPNFPEFVAVGMVDDVQIDYYDSNIRRRVPKQEWMNIEVDAEYWKSPESTLSKVHQQLYNSSIENWMHSHNQIEGSQVYQVMIGCEWDDETGDVLNGFICIGYDGEDFISFDQKTGTWITLKQQANITKLKWDTNKADNKDMKTYLTQICPDYLEKFVNYGRNYLMRTDLPSVSLLQKTPSSPVSCFATGFYPARAKMFWRKDGEELHENVELGEILPNHDGSFQMNVSLYLSSVAPEDWRWYECVFRLSGVKDNIITKLDKAVIKSNEGSSDFPLGAVIGVVVVLLLLIVGIVGYFLWKKNKKRKEEFQSANTSGPL